MSRKCTVQGITSHAHGCPGDLHTVLVDLDGPYVREDPRGFRSYLLKWMQRHALPVAWVLRTLKGYHVVAPRAVPFDVALAAHRDLSPWGADDDHRRLSVARGYFVLRVTRKPGESRSPYVVMRRFNPQPWTHHAHRGLALFMQDRHDVDIEALDLGGDDALTVETYQTTAEDTPRREGQQTVGVFA